MAEILLRELSNTDIDWLVATGQQQRVIEGTILLQGKQDSESIYLLLDGVLAIALPQNNSGCSELFSSSATHHSTEQEVARLVRGEIVGETLLLDVPATAVVIKAAEDSLVLSIPQQQLVTKLQQDSTFSTHFYRAIALLLAERLQQMLTMPDQLRAASDQPMKEALFVFGELRDSDADWLVAAGQLEKLAPRQVLIQSGRPIDALYIILDGVLSVAVHEDNTNPLTLCFECVEASAASQKVIDRLSRGEMSGTISLLNAHPSPVTIRAIEESLVLAIPRSQLTMKLQQDMGFASRFYRVLAIQLAETLQTAIGLMGCPQQRHQPHSDMNAAVEYDDELNLDSLHKVAQGAARFNWMLQRLGVM